LFFGKVLDDRENKREVALPPALHSGGGMRPRRGQVRTIERTVDFGLALRSAADGADRAAQRRAVALCARCSQMGQALKTTQFSV
jgi:hypothetical protein